MNQLQHRSLATLPLPEETVQSLYDKAGIGSPDERLRAICASHERLRAEVAGLEVLLSDSHKLRDQLSAALALTDTGSAAFVATFPLCHASDVPGWRVVEKIRQILLGT